MKKKETRGRKKLSPDEKKKVVRLLFTGAKIKCAGGEEKLKEKIYSCDFCKTK